MIVIFIRLIGFIGLITSAVCANAQEVAQTNFRPGLWEVTTTSDLLKLVPQMSPEQIQGLRDMAKRVGLEVPKIDQGAASTMLCITPDMAQRDVVPMLNQRQAGCQTSNATRVGNYYSVDLSCNSEQIRGKGSATGSFTTDEAFTGTSSFDGVVQGMPVTQQATTRAKWMAASCGSANAQE